MGEFSFVCDPACAGQARGWLAASLESAFDGDPLRAAVIEDALIIASELVTNSIQAACGQGTLSWQVRPDALALAVDDDAPGWPALLHPSPSAAHGRGLHIVQSLSAEMGFRNVDRGKQVWATLPFPQPDPHR